LGRSDATNQYHIPIAQHRSIRRESCIYFIFHENIDDPLTRIGISLLEQKGPSFQSFPLEPLTQRQPQSSEIRFLPSKDTFTFPKQHSYITHPPTPILAHPNPASPWPAPQMFLSSQNQSIKPLPIRQRPLTRVLSPSQPHHALPSSEISYPSLNP